MSEKRMVYAEDVIQRIRDLAPEILGGWYNPDMENELEQLVCVVENTPTAAAADAQRWRYTAEEPPKEEDGDCCGRCLHPENRERGLFADSCLSVFCLHFDLKEAATMPEKSEFDKALGELYDLTEWENAEAALRELHARQPEMERLYIDGKILPGELQALVMVNNCLEREFIHRQLATGQPLHLNI